MLKLMEQVNEIFKEVFSDDGIVVTRETTADDISDWDSLMHVTLILSMEKGFGVRFSSSEVAKLKSVGDLVDMIAEKRVG